MRELDTTILTRLAALGATILLGCSAEAPRSHAGPGYPGAGTDYHPMPPGAVMHCFDDDGSHPPAATIEHVLEVFSGVSTVHVRLTLDPRFVDNTYGANAIGWGGRGHTYKQLDGSDHAQLLLFDASGRLTLDFAMDYVTQQVTRGVTGGDGEVSTGDAADILAVDTSLSRNFNARGYASYVEDSPATDDSYTANPAAPGWDFRVVYEAWVDQAAFGPAGFGRAEVEYIHASPSKADDNTVVVDPYPCPPDWGECDDIDGCDLPPDNGCDVDRDCPAGEFCAEDGTCHPWVG